MQVLAWYVQAALLCHLGECLQWVAGPSRQFKSILRVAANCILCLFLIWTNHAILFLQTSVGMKTWYDYSRPYGSPPSPSCLEQVWPPAAPSRRYGVYTRAVPPHTVCRISNGSMMVVIVMTIMNQLGKCASNPQNDSIKTSVLSPVPDRVPIIGAVNLHLFIAVCESNPWFTVPVLKINVFSQAQKCTPKARTLSMPMCSEWSLKKITQSYAICECALTLC